MEVVASVVLATADGSEVQGYHDALLAALANGRLEENLSHVGTEVDLVVLAVEGAETQSPSASPSIVTPSQMPQGSETPVATPAPSQFPTTSISPTNSTATEVPSSSPTNETLVNTQAPSQSPNATGIPTMAPTGVNSNAPTTAPPGNETAQPDTAPPANGTESPTSPGSQPTMVPSVSSTMAPTPKASAMPTMPIGSERPTVGPTGVPVPTMAPTAAIPEPTVSPTVGGDPGQSPAPTVTPVRYFVVAGGANAIGYADLNHLVTLSFFDDSYDRYVTSTFQPVEREDAFVTFDKTYDSFANTEEGPLSTQYGSDGAHFGPEVSLGFDLGDLFDEDIVILKAGGKSPLSSAWLPPTSSPTGTAGSYYTRLVSDISDAVSRADQITGSAGPPGHLAGIVWFHGYDDMNLDSSRAAYGTNLQNLINDLRTDLMLPNLPFVIAELGGQGTATTDANELEIRATQKAVADAMDYTVYSETAKFISGFDTTSPSDTYAGYNLYWGRADVMLKIGSQLATDMLLAMAETNVGDIDIDGADAGSATQASDTISI